MESNLSLELKAQEIHERAVGFYKISEQYGYKFLMEVKTIRDEKLYKELGFETFDNYTLNNFNYSKRTINERLQDAENFGEEYERALASYGKHKSHQLATLPKEQRNHIMEHGIDTPNGHKSLEEATTRELEDYKKRNKTLEQQNAQLQSQVEQAQRSEEIAKKQLEDAESREAEVVEKEIVKEVVPDRINKQLENLKNDKKLLEQREKELSDLKRRFKEREQQPETNKYERDSNLTEEEQIASIRFQVETNLLSLRDDANEFLNKVAHTPYREAAIARASDRTKNMMFDVVEEIEAWTRQMRNSLNTSQIIEGD
ncbi:hypothetical protein NW127_11275 [Staphylococcus pettenkoferi]|uniref:hypothetical protein n=1 Tax=Staphylococcus pettenkoferi TaxID=170573 RepID=UPI002275FE98|nr:hypothetical protein [Staphylococcus pettenkoferi]MCY1577227.1 hypothetical protein [Staphylococcus pettenkoferi]MCY1596584.1 hypothetical protein [Staphylococcus pettenkoferi]